MSRFLGGRHFYFALTQKCRGLAVGQFEEVDFAVQHGVIPVERVPCPGSGLTAVPEVHAHSIRTAGRQRDRGGREVRVGEVFVERTEKTGFPGFGFSGLGENCPLRGEDGSKNATRRS